MDCACILAGLDSVGACWSPSWICMPAGLWQADVCTGRCVYKGATFGSISWRMNTENHGFTMLELWNTSDAIVTECLGDMQERPVTKEVVTYVQERHPVAKKVHHTQLTTCTYLPFLACVTSSPCQVSVPSFGGVESQLCRLLCHLRRLAKALF